MRISNMCQYLYEGTYVYMLACICVHMCVYVYANMLVYMWTCIHVYLYASIDIAYVHGRYICGSLHIYVHKYLPSYVYLHV